MARPDPTIATADELFKLSEEAARFRSRVRRACRTIDNPGVDELIAHVEHAESLLFTLGREVESGRLPIEGPGLKQRPFDFGVTPPLIGMIEAKTHRSPANGSATPVIPSGAVSITESADLVQKEREPGGPEALRRDEDRGSPAEDDRQRDCLPGDDPPGVTFDDAGFMFPPGTNAVQCTRCHRYRLAAGARCPDCLNPEFALVHVASDGQFAGGWPDDEPEASKAKPKRTRKANPSFDVFLNAAKPDNWLARIWADSDGDALAIAIRAFSRWSSSLVVAKTSARYSQDVANVGGEKVRRIPGGTARIATGEWIDGEPDPEATAESPAEPEPPTVREIAAGSFPEPDEEPAVTSLWPIDRSYMVNLPEDGSGNPTFLGSFHAKNLAAAIAEAPARFARDVVEGTDLVVTPGPLFLEGRSGPTPISECLTCGERWPAADGLGCPKCIHGPLPDLSPSTVEASTANDRLYDLVAFLTSDDGREMVVGQFTASDPLTPAIPENIKDCVHHPELLKVRPASQAGTLAYACNGCNRVVGGNAPAAGLTCSWCKSEEHRPVVIGEGGEILPGGERPPFRYEVVEHIPLRGSKKIAEFPARSQAEAKAICNEKYPGLLLRLNSPIHWVEPPTAAPAPAPAPMVEDNRPLSDGCRIVWDDREGGSWHGVHRFVIGKTASITIDRDQPDGRTRHIARSIRVDPGTLRREPIAAAPDHLRDITKMVDTREVQGGELPADDADGYGPSHPWYYKLGGVPMAVEDIEPSEDSIELRRQSVLSDLGNRKGAKRAEKLRDMLESAQKGLDGDMSRYRSLVDHGWKAMSPREQNRGDEGRCSDLDSAISLKHNHIIYSKGIVAAIRQLIADDGWDAIEAAGKPRQPPRKTFRALYLHDDDTDPILLDEIKATSFDEAKAALPKLYGHESVRLPGGDLVKIDHDKVELVPVSATPRSKSAWHVYYEPLGGEPFYLAEVKAIDEATALKLAGSAYRGESIVMDGAEVAINHHRLAVRKAEPAGVAP